MLLLASLLQSAASCFCAQRDLCDTRTIQPQPPHRNKLRAKCSLIRVKALIWPRVFVGAVKVLSVHRYVTCSPYINCTAQHCAQAKARLYAYCPSGA